MKIININRILRTTEQSESNKSDKATVLNSNTNKDSFETAPKQNSLNFTVQIPAMPNTKIAKVDISKFEQKTATQSANNSVTPAAASTTQNSPSKPGAVVRSATFLAGEVVGLGKSLASGVADVGKFLYDVESAVIARGHDLIFEGTPNGSFTQVYQPTSSFGTASSEGRGGEAALKIVTEAPDRIREASVRTAILVEQGKYYEGGEAFGSGPLAETTAALGAVQTVTTTPVAAGSFRLATSAEAPAAVVTQAVESNAAATAAPKIAAPVVLPAGPFAQVVAEARAFAGGIAGDCERAATSVQRAIKTAERGQWNFRDALGRPGFHEFATLPDGTIIDPTAGQYLANGMVTAKQIAGIKGLSEAIESGVFTGELHNALRALISH